MRGICAALAGLVLAACNGPHAAGPDLDVILADRPAATLSAYGFFEDDGSPVQGVVPYDLINPLFSDYADKHRFVFVPKGEAAEYVEIGRAHV